MYNNNNNNSNFNNKDNGGFGRGVEMARNFHVFIVAKKGIKHSSVHQNKAVRRVGRCGAAIVK